MRRFTISCLLAVTAACAQGQQVDMDAMMPDSDDLRVSKDEKSLIVKKAGWTWTCTPSIAPAK